MTTNILRRHAILTATGILGVLAASLCGCGSGSGGSGSGGSTGLTPLDGGRSIVFTSMPSPSRAACQPNAVHNDGRARWTILVYMNASNNLQPFSLLNIAQMVAVGSDSNVNIVVQWKQSSFSQIQSCADCIPSFVGTRRYLLHQHNTSSLCTDLNDFTTCSTAEPAVLAADRLADPSTNSIDPSTGKSTSDMGDYHVLANFVNWGLNAYPADNYALVIWDHGSGWRPVYRSATRKALTRAVSQDEATGNEIETQEIQTALTGIPHTLDMVIFDCSLEGMTEVAYQIRNNARVMVCSEESPPGSGYPYHQWLSALKSGGNNACEVGANIVQSFVNYYPGQTDLTQSVIDLGRMANVATNMNALGTALHNDRNAESSLLKNARNSTYVQSYGNDYLTLYAGLIDLYGYAANIKTGSSNSAAANAAVSLETALTDPNTGAVLFSGYGPGKAGSHGLSIYVPAPGTFLTSYSALALSQDAAAWPAFLQSQVQ